MPKCGASRILNDVNAIWLSASVARTRTSLLRRDLSAKIAYFGRMEAKLALTTLTECFRSFGITITNPRQLWAAVSPSGAAVVTLWKHRFTDQNTYDVFYDQVETWAHKRSNKARTKILKKVGIGGCFESIYCVSRDPTAPFHKTIERRIGNRMRLTALNEETGEFRAVVADKFEN
jgi:hypothetical protein